MSQKTKILSETYTIMLPQQSELLKIREFSNGRGLGHYFGEYTNGGFSMLPTISLFLKTI